MSWMIVCDTSCEIRALEHPAPGVQFALAPFKIRIGTREYVDLPTLNVPQMLQAMTDYNGASTSACPSRPVAPPKTNALAIAPPHKIRAYFSRRARPGQYATPCVASTTDVQTPHEARHTSYCLRPEQHAGQSRPGNL